MIPVRMYQDDRQLAWGNNNILQIQLFISQSGFDPPTSELWAQHASSAALRCMKYEYMSSLMTKFRFLYI